MDWLRIAIRLLPACILSWMILLSPPALHAQVENDQDWNTNVTISSDAITVDCSEFLLPIDLGRVLAEVDPINSNQGEMSQSMMSAHEIKMTLQPEAGTGDNLININGCAVDGTKVILKMHDTGDTVTIGSTGNISLSSDIVLDHITALMFVLRGSTWHPVGGPGGPGGGSSITDITDATEATPFTIRRAPGTDDYSACYVTDADVPTCDAYCDGVLCSKVTNIPFGTTHTIQYQGNNCEQIAADGSHSYSNDCKPGKPIFFPALALEVDGTNCTYGTPIQINSGPRVTPLNCADNAGSIFEGNISMLGTGWDGGPVQFTLHVIHGTTETITLAGDWSGMCRAGELVDDTWGTAVQGDVSITTANVIVRQTSGNVTLGGGCVAGDYIFFRFVVDDATFSANAANTDVVGVSMHYLVNTQNGNDEN